MGVEPIKNKAEGKLFGDGKALIGTFESALNRAISELETTKGLNSDGTTKGLNSDGTTKNSKLDELMEMGDIELKDTIRRLKKYHSNFHKLYENGGGTPEKQETLEKFDKMYYTVCKDYLGYLNI